MASSFIIVRSPFAGSILLFMAVHFKKIGDTKTGHFLRENRASCSGLQRAPFKQIINDPQSHAASYGLDDAELEAKNRQHGKNGYE
jgi:hypothetical protein